MVAVGTAFAFAAELAELILLVAVAAVGAQVVVPLTAVRAEAVLTVVVSLAVLAQTTVFALRIVGALLAVGAEVVFVVARSYAVAVGATGIICLLLTAFLTIAAVIAFCKTGRFSTFSASFAEPVIFLAARSTMITSFWAPYNPTFTPACATLRAVLLISITAFAESAF